MPTIHMPKKTDLTHVLGGGVRYPRLLQKLYFEPVMISMPAFYSIERALESHFAGSSDRRLDAGGDGPSERVCRIYERRDRLGIIHINGIIDKHVSLYELDCYGGCDLNDVDAAIEQARADTNVEHVLLLVNSPGGSATGVPETAERLARLAAEKPVTVFGDCQICSAAIYIASQASEIVITASTEIGSIGTYMALLDVTRMMEMEGLAINLIKAGKFKAAGAPFKKLEDEEREHFQRQVDRLNTSFVEAVSAGRPDVPREAMEGQTFVGTEAIEVGLADDMALGLDEVLAALSPQPIFP